MHRPLCFAASMVFVLVAAGCGGDDAASAPATSPGSASTAAPAPGSTATGAESDATAGSVSATSGTAGGDGTGFISVGDVRHDLEVTRCFSIGGAVGGGAVSVTEPDNVQVSFEFAPQDWRERDAGEGWESTGSVNLSSDDPYVQWVTGQDLVAGYNFPAGIDVATLDITSVEVAADGSGVSGTGTFVDLSALMATSTVEPVEGTFQFSCPPR
jgi:hypothetical protein